MENKKEFNLSVFTEGMFTEIKEIEDCVSRLRELNNVLSGVEEMPKDKALDDEVPDTFEYRLSSILNHTQGSRQAFQKEMDRLAKFIS